MAFTTLNTSGFVDSSKDGNSRVLFIAFRRMIKAENNNSLPCGFQDTGQTLTVNSHLSNFLKSFKILDMMKAKKVEIDPFVITFIVT